MIDKGEQPLQEQNNQVADTNERTAIDVQGILYGNENQKSMTSSTQMTNYSQSTQEQLKNLAKSNENQQVNGMSRDQERDSMKQEKNQYQNKANNNNDLQKNIVHLDTQNQLNTFNKSLKPETTTEINQLYNHAFPFQNSKISLSQNHQDNALHSPLELHNRQNSIQSSQNNYKNNPNNVNTYNSSTSSQNNILIHQNQIKVQQNNNMIINTANNSVSGGVSNGSQVRNNGYFQGNKIGQKMNEQVNVLTQQQIQQLQYKTAKTQMYEKMLIQQSINSQMLPAQQSQQYMNSQQLNFQNNQAASLQLPKIGNIRNDGNSGSQNGAMNQNGIQSSLYKTTIGSNQGNQHQQPLLSNNNLQLSGSNIQSPFLQTQKTNTLQSLHNGLIVTSSNHYIGASQKKKAISPRTAQSAAATASASAVQSQPQLNNNQNITHGYQDHQQPNRMLGILQDDYSNININDNSNNKGNVGELIESSKNRNRLKSNNNANAVGIVMKESTMSIAAGNCNNESGQQQLQQQSLKEQYSSEKFGQHLLMNSDSHNVLAVARVQGSKEEMIKQGQLESMLMKKGDIYIGEQSMGNGNGVNGKKLVTDDAVSMYQQNTVTPSLMSSQSNKRQSHLLMINQNHQLMLLQQQQQQIHLNQGFDNLQQNLQQSQNIAHNFFSRRTISNKDAPLVGNFKQQFSHPPTSHQNLQMHQYTNLGNGGVQVDQFSNTANHYQLLSPTIGIQQNQQRGLLMIEGSHSSTIVNNGLNINQAHSDSRMKFAVSVAGMRASHDNSPMKINIYPSNGIQGPYNNNNQMIQMQNSQIQNINSQQQSFQLQQQQQQQPVKIPVICGFHKRVLLLTSQIVNQNGTLAALPGTSAAAGGLSLGINGMIQPQRESINKKIRNRNPNCNHNNNSVFYAPCYNNVKYDDSYKKKEEVLRKVFFKECAREDEKRTVSQQQNIPNQNNTNAKDPFTYLKPIENFLIQTLFVEYDYQQAIKHNPTIPPPQKIQIQQAGSSLFTELGLEQAIVAHKAFLLALIQSGKITYENMLKVLHEFKQAALDFDHECIYCKYSQYALRESTKVIRNNSKASTQLNEEKALQENDNRNLYLSPQPQNSESLLLSPQQNSNKDLFGQDPRIDYLIRMFQSQLFKRSFINTSLMIIQRKMNEKLLQKQRLPPGVNSGQQSAETNNKPKKPVKSEKKQNGPPMSSLEWIASQMQKLAKNLSNPKDKDKYLELKEKYYREFLMKINQSNNAIIPFPKQTFTPYKYYIGKGNNSILVRNCLKQRFWWSMGDFEEWDEYNFIWTQWKSNKILAKIKTNIEVQQANQEQTGSTTNKSGLSNKEGESGISMLSTDRDSNSSAETLLATPTKRKRVATALQSNQNGANTTSALQIRKTISASKNNILSKNGQQANQDDSKEKKETSHSVITYNHMENNFHLSNKKALYYNMKLYYDSTGQDWCSVLPLTFHIKEGPSDKEFQRFMEVFKDFDKGSSNSEKLGKSIWIVKPGENTNRGCGIQVCKELTQIKELISNTHINGQKRSYIIQKYIEKPLLYKNRKFDIRCFTLMTTVTGNLQGYWYNEGYLRTSCKEFNLKNVTNRLIHLTNDAVQKKSDDYGKFENGNKLSYTEFQKYLDSVDIKCNIVKEIIPQLKKMATDTIKSCSRKIDPHRRHNTFEIFGYDFMIDEDLKPWLIEVNTNPCLELSAPYLSRLIPAMVENAVKIAIDPLFPPPPWPNAKKHMIPDCTENNKFELVFNELTDSAELKNLPIDDIALNGIIEEDEMEEEGSDNDGEDDIA